MVAKEGRHSLAVEPSPFKLQNLFPSPVGLAVGVLESNRALSFQQVLTIPSFAIKDALVQVNNCTPCTPRIFFADGQFLPSHRKVPLNFIILAPQVSLLPEPQAAQPAVA